MLSYVLRENPLTAPLGHKQSVLVTGAAGRIGSYFCRSAADRYRLRLFVHSIDDDCREIEQFGEVVEGDVSDWDSVRQACEGIDVVLHLAAVPSPSAVWDSLLPVNIVGTYNVCAAAKAAGCRKVVYASSIHAVSGYPAGIQVKTTEPVNPGDLYGVSKCFGEALGRYMSQQENLPFIALRIGAFQPVEAAYSKDISNADGFISQRDLQQLLELCVDDEQLQFAVFHALSGNTFNRLDITNTRELLGYTPVDNFFEENPELDPLDLHERIRQHNLADGQESGLREDLKPS